MDWQYFDKTSFSHVIPLNETKDSRTNHEIKYIHEYHDLEWMKEKIIFMSVRKRYVCIQKTSMKWFSSKRTKKNMERCFEDEMSVCVYIDELERNTIGIQTERNRKKRRRRASTHAGRRRVWVSKWEREASDWFLLELWANGLLWYVWHVVSTYTYT